MNRRVARRTLLLLLAALLVACSPATAAAPSASPTPTTRASGVYVYQPAPLIWQLVTIVDGQVANGAGAVFEWSCAGKRWAIGTFPAKIDGGYLLFADERFALAAGVPAAPWRIGADPRSLPAPVCGPVPTTKPALSPDAARELIKGRVTAIDPVLVPTRLPDGVSAIVDARAEAFSVTYTGGGVRIGLATVLANPQPPQPGGTQRRLLFRGDTRAFYQALDGRPTTSRTLLWNEHATRTGSGPTSVAYSLTADGLSEPEFWSIADSLR